jgi:hypothetical protein
MEIPILFRYGKIYSPEECHNILKEQFKKAHTFLKIREQELLNKSVKEILKDEL